ncbi:MAG TPA: enolase C-terminal domain-like protein [Streptosporangiaceae bacterium]|nr:enolase C-terminal domain-like protein [Streptosporangiaceae bacterium]
MPRDLPSDGVTISRVDVYVLDLPLKHVRTLSKGAVSSGKAASDAVHPVLVRVTSTDGAAGFGRVRPPTPWLGETTSSIVSAIRHFYGPLLIGADASQRASNARRLDQALPGNSVALTAIDMAVHDLLGQTYGIPVYELLGGRREPIPMDWSVSLNPPDVMVAECVRAVEEYGCRTLCLKSGAQGQWRDDVQVFRAVRAAVGPDVEIGLDPNEGYDVATTLRVAHELGEAEIAYLEQPLPRRDIQGLSALRGAVPAQIMIDEGAVTLPQAAEVIARGACDALVLKVWKSGGFADALVMAAMAATAGLGTTVGGVSHGSILEAAACAHLYACCEPSPLAAEFILGLNVLDPDPISELPDDFQLAGGTALPPSGPGLGVGVNMAEAEARTLDSFVIG